jgi:hypothetical protein
MAIRLRLTGSVTDAPRSLTFTPSGTPRFCFSVRVGGLRKRTYRVTSYGSQARFGDFHLHLGDRVQIEGAYLRRSRMIEGDVRADTIRHIGRSAPPEPPFSIPTRAVPPRPNVAETASRSRRTRRDFEHDERSERSEAVIDAALAALT